VPHMTIWTLLWEHQLYPIIYRVYKPCLLQIILQE
jgi:hypothetical protein